jgi:site-specific DNA recombinase
MTTTAVGIVRVSKTAGRDGESFASPQDQRAAIEAACERNGWRLVQSFEELDVSGETALENRAGLRTAIEMVEDGRAQVVLASYLDRLCRSLTVQRRLVERVEQAGGEVHALDAGRITHGSATKKLSGTLLGAVAEYHRDVVRERSGEAQRRAITRGVPPFSHIPPGYRRGPDGVLVVHEAEARLVAEAFAMRARDSRPRPFANASPSMGSGARSHACRAYSGAVSYWGRFTSGA